MCNRLKISAPVRAKVRTQEGLKVLGGRLQELGEGKARIRLDRPLAVGTELEVLVEFKDRKGREIRFRYKGQVTSAINDSSYEVDVSFEEGVGMSGEHAGEILAEVFPNEG